MAGHAQLKFVMTECSKTQIRLTGPILIYYKKLAGYGDILISFECYVPFAYQHVFIICVIWGINMMRNSFDLQICTN